MAQDTAEATKARPDGLPLREAVRWANVAGGIVVGKLGTATVAYDELFGPASPASGRDQGDIA